MLLIQINPLCGGSPLTPSPSQSTQQLAAVCAKAKQIKIQLFGKEKEKVKVTDAFANFQLCCIKLSTKKERGRETGRGTLKCLPVFIYFILRRRLAL